MSAACVVDGARIPAGAVVCVPCIEGFRRQVLEARGISAELVTTAARQGRQSSGGGGRGGSRPLPVDLGAVDAAERIRRALWALLVGARGTRTAGRVPRRDASARDLAGAVIRFEGEVMRGGQFPTLYAALRRAVAEGTTLVDRRPDRRVVGECQCGRPIVTPNPAGVYVCRGCGRAHDVAEVVRRRSRRVMDTAATPAEIRGYLRSVYGVSLAESSIRTMASRGKFRAVSVRPVRFRVGDVVAYWESVHGPLDNAGTPGSAGRVSV